MRVLLLAALLDLLASGTAVGEQPSPPKELLAAVNTWMRSRADLVVSCDSCGGTGWIRVGQVSGSKVPCTRCHGTTLVSSGGAVHLVYWFPMTVARKLHGSLPSLEAMQVKVDLNREKLQVRGGLRVAEVRMVDATHARVVYAGLSDTIVVGWIHALGGDPQKPTKRWCIFTNEVDGPWPEEPAPPDVVPPGLPPRKEEFALGQGPLIGVVREMLRRMLEKERVHHELVSASREGTTLVVGLAAEARNERELADMIRKDLVPATLAALRLDSSDEAIRLVFLADWDSETGGKKQLPWITYEIRREQVDGWVASRRAPESLVPLYVRHEHTHEGYLLSIGQKK